MNSLIESKLTDALLDVFDRQTIPEVDVTRILARSSHERQPRQTMARARLAGILAIAAMVVLVMTVGGQRGWALGIEGHRSISEALARALTMLHLQLPKTEPTIQLRVENYQYGNLARIQAQIPFHLIKPSGVPTRYGVTVHGVTIRGNTPRNRTIGAYWIMKVAPERFHRAKAISLDSVEVDEFAHGHAAGIPPASPDKTVSLEFNPDGSLRRAHVVNLFAPTIKRFTIGDVDVVVIVRTNDASDAIADRIRSAMIARSARAR